MHRNASDGQILDFQNTCTIDSACDEIRLEIQSRKCLRKSKHNLHEIHMYMYYGINGEVLNWISAWLTQRNQQVCVDGDMRGTKPVRSGEPQGTVLGPLCFLLYINNIGDLIYVSVVWNPYRQCHINKIEMVQRRATRFVTSNYSREPRTVTNI